MGNSLQDQLLKAGVADSAQAKKARSEKRKQAKQKQKNKANPVDQSKLLAKKSAAEKKERDRQLNQKKANDAEQKAIDAQINQLIEANRQLTGDEEIPYHFTDHDKVKKIYVSELVRNLISRGKSAIVKNGKFYEVVPAEITDKIRSRDDTRIILLNDSGKDEQKDDDPYAEYQVPDDLVW